MVHPTKAASAFLARARTSAALALAALLAADTPSASAPSIPEQVSAYVERYFATFPSRSVQAGRSDRVHELEDLSPSALRDWLAFNRATRDGLRTALRTHPAASQPSALLEDRVDAEAVLAHALREIHDLEVRRLPERNPLYWTDLLGNATVFLLVRDELPLPDRVRRAEARVRFIPGLAAQARSALVHPADTAPELCAPAARQARATARFYREAWPALGGGMADGKAAASALETLGAFLDDLGRRATGSPRLGLLYPATLRLGTGVDDAPGVLLARAEADLVRRREEAAAYGRRVWAEAMGADAMAPADDRELLRRLFARLSHDRARTVEEFVGDYRNEVRRVEAFVRERGIVALPDPLTLLTDRSPAFFAGQSVGGVYPAGPWDPEAKTLFYLPSPADGATAGEKDAFFRDFNHHFNVMITPHEILPGHYLQLKWAARHPRKVRFLFADGVYVEGWGTFCERLLLDLGWGGPLARLAHLKKQLENTARAVVDIRVHTQGMTRDEVLAYVRDEALQDEQFASNMWMRALTTSPQITTYWLGYGQVRSLYDDLRAARGSAFSLRAFMDGMLELGPVPVSRYRERLLSRLPARDLPR